MTKKLKIINQNTEEGFQDLEFNVVEYSRDKNSNHIIKALGVHNAEVVGFEVLFKDNMRPGIVDGEINKTAFYPEGIIIRSIGSESDRFVKKLSELYELEYLNKPMKQDIIFTSFALGGNPSNFEEQLKFKVFYDDNDEQGLYSELYININMGTQILEFKEKDNEYRENIYKSLSE